MTKKLLISLVIVAALCLLAGLMVVRPVVRAGQLSRVLSQTSAAGDAADVARELLKIGNERALAAVADYAAASDLRAFDARHAILLIHDPATSRTHLVHVRPRGEPIDTGDPALDRAMAAAIPEVAGETFRLGDPPEAFVAVRVVESVVGHVDFLLESEDAGASTRYRFRFEDDRLASEALLPAR